jgi:hypothetical protein
MEFEDMKKIWDEQNNENIYAINESELHRRVIKNKNRVKRMVNKFEWTYLAVMIALSLFAIIVGIQRHHFFKFADAFIFLLAAGYFYKSRLDRIKYEGQSNLSILDDLEQAIRSLDYHGKRHKYFRLWLLLPMVSAVLINLAYTYDTRPLWTLLIALGSFVFADWAMKKELQCKILPKKEDLMHLRSLLLKDE